MLIPAITPHALAVALHQWPHLGSAEGVHGGLHACEVSLAQRGPSEDVASDAPHVLAGAGAAAGAAGRRGRAGAARAAITAVGHVLHERTLWREGSLWDKS